MRRENKTMLERTKELHSEARDYALSKGFELSYDERTSAMLLGFRVSDMNDDEVRYLTTGMTETIEIRKAECRLVSVPFLPYVGESAGLGLRACLYFGELGCSPSFFDALCLRMGYQGMTRLCVGGVGVPDWVVSGVRTSGCVVTT